MGTQDDFFEAKGAAQSPPGDSPGFFTRAAPTGNDFYRGVDVAGKQFGVRGSGADAGAPGVIGQGGGGNADGVRGYGTRQFSGVAGWGDTSAPALGDNGTGVFGQGGAPAGPGIRGIGYGVPPTSASAPNAVGVFGQGGVGNSDGVYGIGSGAFSGVAGFGDFNAGNGTGVFGPGGPPFGPGVRGIGHGGLNVGPPANNAVGVFGLGGTGNSDGVLGIGSPAGGVGGAGVRGIGGSQDLTAEGKGFYVQSGVIGIGGGGPSNAAPPEFNAVGVFGQAGPGQDRGERRGRLGWRIWRWLRGLLGRSGLR